MNTNVLCNRFEREGILRIERGLSLDAHFDECPSCEVARQKYESILAELPAAQPDVSPQVGWQSRVLQAAAKSDAARPGFSLMGFGRPLMWTAFAGAAALAATVFVHGSQSGQFEVQAETHAPSAAELAMEEATDPVPIVGDEEITNTEPVAPPAPVAPKPAPRQMPPVVQTAAPKTPQYFLPELAPEKPAPVPSQTREVTKTEPEVTSTAQTNSSPHRYRVTRPDKLVGLKIKYPPAAMKAKIGGETSVQCTIRADGRNTNCRILKSLPYLDDAVIRAVEASRSEPIRVDGKPVDNSDHIWHITITLREIVDDRTSARALPILNWN